MLDVGQSTHADEREDGTLIPAICRMSHAMTRTCWSNELTLDVPMMDRSHHVLFNDLSSLASQDGDKFVWRFASMVGDLERDFYLEDEWMERIAFGDAPSHREQHAIILAALHRTHAKVMAGDIEFGRMMVIALSAWLDNHIATTDGRLALAIRRAEPH